MNKQMQTSGEGGEGGIAKLLLVCLFQQAFRIQVLCLNILEVAVSTHLQFFGGRIVTNDDTLFVHLQGADSPHLHHGTLDCMIEARALLCPFTIIITSRALSTVPTPTVRAVLAPCSRRCQRNGSWQ